MSDLAETLGEILGRENVRTVAEDDATAAASASWYPIATKARMVGAAPSADYAFTVRPGSAGEVAAVLAQARARGTRLLARGGGSNTVGSTLPDRSDARPVIALDLSRLDRVAWDEESLTVTAGAGVRLADLEAQLNRHGYTLGSLPRSASLATVGGAVATDAVGSLSGRYGRQRDLTLALEAILTSGEIIRTSAHGSGGATLHPLLIGSEGALAVITEATLAMSPLPEVRAWAPFTFASVSDAFDALRLVYRSDARPSVARLFDPDAAASRLPAPGPALLLIGVEGSELVQTGAYQMAYAVCQKVGGEPLPPEIGDTWFEERTNGAGLFTANARPGGLADVFSVWVPWARAKTVHAALRRAASPHVTALSVEAVDAGAHGTALDLWWEAQAEPPTYEEARALHARITDAVLPAALDAGAEAVAHHWGIGPARRACVEQERGPAHTATLQAIKAALDPDGILPPLP